MDRCLSKMRWLWQTQRHVAAQNGHLHVVGKQMQGASGECLQDEETWWTMCASRDELLGQQCC